MRKKAYTQHSLAPLLSQLFLSPPNRATNEIGSPAASESAAVAQIASKHVKWKAGQEMRGKGRSRGSRTHPKLTPHPTKVPKTHTHTHLRLNPLKLLACKLLSYPNKLNKTLPSRSSLGKIARYLLRPRCICAARLKWSIHPIHEERRPSTPYCIAAAFAMRLAAGRRKD
ncbi:hypothetical protein EV127DRAFT_416872 [Xylaria flabelliformis]|nr:hypothetical protein EV127DRAFT_416872 [Xylaria flabelliformis]